MSDSDTIKAAYTTQLGTLFSTLYVASTGDGGLPAFIQKFSTDYKLLRDYRDAALAIVTPHEDKPK